MDFIAPALVGLGFWFIYEAWQSHSTGQPLTPVADIRKALKGTSVVPSSPGQVGFGAAAPGIPVNQQTGVAG